MARETPPHSKVLRGLVGALVLVALAHLLLRPLLLWGVVRLVESGPRNASWTGSWVAIAATDDSTPEATRWRADALVGRMQSPAVEGALRAHLAGDAWEVRRRAARALARMPS